MTPEIMLQLLALAGGCAAVYAAIKADLVRAMMKAEHAHERLDDHLKEHSHA